MDLTRRRLVSLMVTLTLLSLAGALWRPRPDPARTSIRPSVYEFYSNHVRSDGGRLRDAYAMPRSFDDGWPSADLFGNEVNAAVAAYEVDPIGTLYEQHSPQTELPQLAEPRS